MIPSFLDIQNGIVANEKMRQLQELLDNEPPSHWVKIHPYINGYKYLSIDKYETLLKAIFPAYKIEITGQGDSFNGVYVTVRVHYQHPITMDWSFHDGIGASQLQTKKGASAADFSAINNGALSMAYPLAKTLAVKDACDHFGRLFGSDLNRRDLLDTTQAKDEIRYMVNDWDYVQGLFEDKESFLTDKEREHALRIINNKEKTSYRKVTAFLENKNVSA